MVETYKSILKNTLSDFHEGGKILKRYHASTPLSIEKSRDKILNLVTNVLVGEIAGLGFGFVSSLMGAAASLPLEAATNQPLIYYTAAAISGLAGTAFGILNGLAITPQTELGRKQRIKRQRAAINH